MLTKPYIFLCCMFIGNITVAENFEVKMLNRGLSGSMVFEPNFLKVNVGDIIYFKSTDKGHNVESIKGMLPIGVQKFKSKISDDFVFTVPKEGLYGIKCRPHYMMGMVGLIQAGSASNFEDSARVKHRGKAKKRFKKIFNQISQ